MFQKVTANTFGINGKTDQCSKDIEYTQKKLSNTFRTEKYNNQTKSF